MPSKAADISEPQRGAGGTTPVFNAPSAADRVNRLAERYAGRQGVDLLRPLIEREFPGRLAIVSSFGAEAAVVLALVAEIDRCTPVLFIDTGKLFPETLHYRDRLIRQLGLADVRSIAPDPGQLAAVDPNDALWQQDPDRCCDVRKVAPLHRALRGFEAWVSGRKRYHGAARTALPVFERDDHDRIKINPVAGWPKSRVEEEFASRGLPRHPLEARGYLSIGCIPCTDCVQPGEDLRAGRWRGIGKTECGIHRPRS